MPLPLIANAGACLALVLALVLGAARLAQWRGLIGAPRGQGALRVQGCVALDRKRRLHLIETDHGAALVLTGGDSDGMLRLGSSL